MMVVDVEILVDVLLALAAVSYYRVFFRFVGGLILYSATSYS